MRLSSHLSQKSLQKRIAAEEEEPQGFFSAQDKVPEITEEML